MRKFKCIKEFHSVVCPEENYGALNRVYTLQDVFMVKGYTAYYKFYELAKVGWLNKERFQEII